VNDYMEVLIKETATLHKVLSRYLAEPIVEVRDFLLLLFFPLFRPIHIRSTI
jgi:hypothetical protein